MPKVAPHYLNPHLFSSLLTEGQPILFLVPERRQPVEPLSRTHTPPRLSLTCSVALAFEQPALLDSIGLLSEDHERAAVTVAAAAPDSVWALGGRSLWRFLCVCVCLTWLVLDGTLLGLVILPHKRRRASSSDRTAVRAALTFCQRLPAYCL